MYHLCAHPLLNIGLKNTITNFLSRYPRQCLVVSSSLVVSSRHAFLIHGMLIRHLTLILKNHKYDKFLIMIMILKKPHSPIQKNQCVWNAVEAEVDWGEIILTHLFKLLSLRRNYLLILNSFKNGIWITCSIFIIPRCCCRRE